MPGLRELLNRFRPTGAPGAASVTGVPVDRRARAESELEPVFAALAASQWRCGELRRIATALAANRVTDAHAEAEAMIARAQRAAPQDRVASAVVARQAADAELTRIEQDADRRSVHVRERSDQMMTELVADAISHMLTGIAALSGINDSHTRNERP